MSARAGRYVAACLTIVSNVSIAVVGFAVALSLWGHITTPRLTLDSESAPAPMTAEEAEQVTLDRYNELADPGCRPADAAPPAAPLSAIVKVDGTIDVTRIPADDALTAAQAGEVWILGWCESEPNTPNKKEN